MVYICNDIVNLILSYVPEGEPELDKYERELYYRIKAANDDIMNQPIEYINKRKCVIEIQIMNFLSKNIYYATHSNAFRRFTYKYLYNTHYPDDVKRSHIKLFSKTFERVRCNLESIGELECVRLYKNEDVALYERYDP